MSFTVAAMKQQVDAIDNLTFERDWGDPTFGGQTHSIKRKNRNS
jgi:hypothetical protein